MMFKKICVIFLFLLFISSFIGFVSAVTVNGVDFNLTKEYLGGENKTDGYQVNNTFGIFCIDDMMPQKIGFWDRESDYSEDLEIGNHPVRYYYSYNKYVSDNMSHAYFTSGDSFYEIFWVGNNITPDIEKLIRNTPDSKIDSDSFYSIVNESIDTYVQSRNERLNYDSQYNYYESRSSQQDNSKGYNDEKIRELLISYYHP